GFRPPSPGPHVRVRRPYLCLPAGLPKLLAVWSAERGGRGVRAAPGAGTPGCECPPATACGHRLLLDFAPGGTRSRVIHPGGSVRGGNVREAAGQSLPRWLRWVRAVGGIPRFTRVGGQRPRRL